MPKYFTEHVVNGVAYKVKDTGARTLIADQLKMVQIEADTDFDTLITAGLYRGVSGNISSYINAPEIAGMNYVLEVIPEKVGSVILQRATTYGNNRLKVFSRQRSGNDPVWSEWRENMDADRIYEGELIPDGTDLNTLTEYKTYRAASSYTYINAPDISTNYTLDVIPVGSVYVIQRAISYGNASMVVYTRTRSGTGLVWSRWYAQMDSSGTDEAIGSIPQQVTESFIPASYSARGANTGMRFRVMSYNAANYNNDTSTYLPNDKLLNLKRFIRSADVDLILLQEEGQYVDGSTKDATDWIYNPVHPYKSGTGGTTIRSKTPIGTNSVLKYSNGRALRYAVIEIGGKTILTVSTHPSPASEEGGVEKRAVQYEELFKWVNRLIQLETYSGGTMVTAPEWTHCIIGMDANSGTDTDKANLIGFAHEGGFNAANGEEFGWFITHPKKGATPDWALDNIIVSDNVIINDVEVYSNIYKSLYSDHVPLVADLTLLDL